MPSLSTKPTMDPDRFSPSVKMLRCKISYGSFGFYLLTLMCIGAGFRFNKSFLGQEMREGSWVATGGAVARRTVAIHNLAQETF